MHSPRGERKETELVSVNWNYFRIAILVGGGVTLITLLGAYALACSYVYLVPSLPSTDSMRNVELQVPLRVYTRSGALIAQIGEQRRIPVGYDQIPELVKHAFLAAEDERFFEHHGIDYFGVVRAVLIDLLSGDKSQGASTITMQAARNMFLNLDKTYRRKLQETFVTYRMEHEFTKQEIFGLYMNVIFFGHPVSALAEEDHVHIQPEDHLLGELVLHAVGDESLLQLAPIGLVEVEEHVAGGLHGDGAGALALVTGEQIDEHRAHHAEVIDAVVLEEALVFGGEKRVLDELGDLVVADRDAALLADLRDQRAGAGVHAQGHLQLDVAHGIRRGERGDQVDVAAGQRVGAEKCDQRHTAGDEHRRAKVIPIHRNQLCLLALPARAMHSTRRFKGKLTERWGRKASGLRDARAYDSGVAVRTLTYSAAISHARREGGSSDRPGMHLPPAEAKLSVSRMLGQHDVPFVDLWCRRSARASRFRQCARLAWRTRSDP